MKKTSVTNLPFIDLTSQQNLIRENLDLAIKRVLSHGEFIMGPEVLNVEVELAKRSNTNFCITCGSGTDALTIPLMAANIKKDDVVFVPSFTFTSSAEVIALRGAIPFFVDIDSRTFNMDAENLESSIKECLRSGGKPKAIITVDLFGQPVDFDSIISVAEKYNLWILDDAAQSFGANYKSKPIGSFAKVTATSFYPSKPLGCYGDGGAILTNDEDLFNKMKSIRTHGYKDKLRKSETLGLTSRFDSIQAAVLLEKLKIFNNECVQRNKVAEIYTKELCSILKTPVVIEEAQSVWAQYTIISDRRDSISSYLSGKGIPSALFYPFPLHLQIPFLGYPMPKKGLPFTEKLATQVLSLPMHPYLDEDTQYFIISAIREAIKG